MTNERFDALFGGPPRKPEDRLTQREMDLAASDPGRHRRSRAAARALASPRRPASATCAWPAVSRSIASPTASCCAKEFRRHLDAAGGGRCRRRARRGARGPSSASQAAAPALANAGDGMQGSYLGPGLRASGYRAQPRPTAARSSSVWASDEILDAPRAGSRGRQGGRLVPGPHGVRPARARRPLDPRRRALADDAEALNLKVKYRESFRPFAPSVLREDVADWFELDDDSPYMLLVARRADRAPASR